MFFFLLELMLNQNSNAGRWRFKQTSLKLEQENEKFGYRKFRQNDKSTICMKLWKPDEKLGVPR